MTADSWMSPREAPAVAAHYLPTEREMTSHVLQTRPLWRATPTEDMSGCKLHQRLLAVPGLRFTALELLLVAADRMLRPNHDCGIPESCAADLWPPRHTSGTFTVIFIYLHLCSVRFLLNEGC